ncbi:MAG: glycosyltransferase family 2 protein [Thermoanaerobaculia bacterium]|nr:glycosyltransferase family 2 protein [Thermoanaerobaculia bacterium]
MKISLILVNYRSADLVETAIASARKVTSHELELVIVDNSRDLGEIERLDALFADRLVISEKNLGYGAGANRGVASSTGDVVIVSNPDVVFASGSIDALVAPLSEESVMMTGPAFFWDEELSWRLPPAETMGFREQFRRNLAMRFGPMRERVSRERLERRIRFWTRTEPVDVEVLSGAVMAMRREDLARFEFDERYPLYFEEVDLMRRLRESGGSIRYVPAARVRHLWAQSAARNPDAEAMFDRSMRRFHRRWHGRAGSALLRLMASGPPRSCDWPNLEDHAISVPGEGKFLVEVGDGPEFLMAAGRFVSDRDVRLPEEALAISPLDELCCRIVNLENREVVGRWTVTAGG